MLSAFYASGRGRYDPLVPPTSNRTDGHSDAGTTVFVQFRILRLMDVDVTKASATLATWVRLRWTDTRLSWNPEDYGGITTLKVLGRNFADAQEGNEAWVPDITVYNGREGFTDTLQPAMMDLANDGSIFWSRPGRMELMCRFAGLVAFPYDNLNCTSTLGGWATGSDYQHVELVDGDGIDRLIHDDQDTISPSYGVYTVLNVSATKKDVMYDCCNYPFPTIRLKISIKRNDNLEWLLIYPPIFFTFISNFAYIMPPDDGARVGFVVTLLLTMEVLKVFTEGYIPPCGEHLWIDYFLFLLECLVVATTLYSAVALWVARHESDTILHPWVRYSYHVIFDWYAKRSSEAYARNYERVSASGTDHWVTSLHKVGAKS